MRTRLPIVLASIAFGVTLWTLPAWWCERGAGAWFAGEATCQNRLAQTVAGEVTRGLSTRDYETESDRFDGEWLFGTYLMGGIGLCQIVQQHPEELAQWQPAIENCIRQLLSPAVREFDRKAWNRGALESLSEDHGHAAYLGYLNFLLSLYRQILPENEFADWNDLITETLVRRTRASPNGLIATYPGEWYPVDNCPVLASIVIHDLATGGDHSAFLAQAESHLRRACLDPSTGLLIQALTEDGRPADLPRGSGSTLGLFFSPVLFRIWERKSLPGFKRTSSVEFLDLEPFGSLFMEWGAIRISIRDR